MFVGFLLGMYLDLEVSGIRSLGITPISRRPNLSGFSHNDATRIMMTCILKVLISSLSFSNLSS